MLLIQCAFLTCQRSVVCSRVGRSGTSIGEARKLVGGSIGVVLDGGSHGACVLNT